MGYRRGEGRRRRDDAGMRGGHGGRPSLRILRDSNAIHHRPRHFPPVRLVQPTVADVLAVLHVRVPHLAAYHGQRVASHGGRGPARGDYDISQLIGCFFSGALRIDPRRLGRTVRAPARAVGCAVPAAGYPRQPVLRRPRPVARAADVHVHVVSARVVDKGTGGGEGE